MASLISKAMVYLGLVDESPTDRDPDSDLDEAQARDESRRIRPVPAPLEGRRVEPPPTNSRITAGAGRVVAGVRTVPSSRTSVLVVEEFGDAKVLADWVRDGVPVVIDLRNTDPDITQRVIDFSSGLIYALEGRMRKVGDSLVLVSPAGSELAADEKRRLAALGVYQLDD